MPVRVPSSYGVVVLALCLAAPPLFAQPAARTTTTSPGESGGAARAPINYDTAHLSQKLSAARASGKITLDGRLDEPSWATAPLAHQFIQNDPREGAPATYDTEVRVLYDDDALYFGVFASDDEAIHLTVNDLKKDYDVNASDGFRLVLDTFHDGRNGYQFATNPGGARWDSQMANEGRDNNANWDGIWDVKTRITEAGWYAEFWIPFRTLKFNHLDDQVWGINFERKLRRLNEDSYWSPIPRIFDAQRVSLAGTLEGMRGLHAGRNIRIKPYVLDNNSRTGTRGLNSEFQGGLDVKYGVTTGLVWDFTVNTDFSQVEADEQQVNLTRFNLFFPEKRDFFLENQGIFAFGNEGGGPGGGGGGGGGFGGRGNQAQDMRLFFTRRIGLSDAGQAVPILAGTRLSGREGAYSVGLLNIQQREDQAVPSTNFTAIRLRRDVLANSDIGAIILNQEVAGPQANRMAGVDANLRFGFLQVNAFAAKSMSATARDASGSGSLVTRGGFNYQNRKWRVNARYTTIGNQFDDQMGFVPRVGVRETAAQINRTLRPKWLPRAIREFQPHWVLTQFNDLTGRLDTRQQDFHFPINFSNGANMETGWNTNVEDIDEAFTLNSARGSRIAAGRHEYTEYFLLYRGNSAAKLATNFRVGIGQFYDGDRRSVAWGPTFRPNEKLNTSMTIQINDISLPGVSYVSTLPTLRLNYNFNTRVFLNALVQYNTDTHQLNSNVRFNVIHHPLSDFFFVYNERRDERSGLLQDRALIGKFTQMMAF